MDNEELKKAETNPAKFSSQYDSEVKNTYSQIAKRPDFKYEAASDPAYRAYRDSYQREGRQAMESSMAEAADLTGGYGSSYAQRLGQQQYGAYLEKLNDVMPELYAQAYQRYKDEGDSLKERMTAAGSLADMEYGRYKDEQDRADTQAQFDYKKQQDAFKNLADIISSTGYVPSDEELRLSGMSAEQAYSLGYEFMRQNNLLPDGQHAYAGLYADEPGGISREWLKLNANLP